MTTQTEQTAAFLAARAQRADLRNGLIRLERAIATPVPGRVSEWAEEVHDALVDVGATFERHIAVTEGPNGLHGEVMATAPRLGNAVAALKDEHVEIRNAIARDLQAIRELASAPDAEHAAGVRERTLDLMTEISRHRQRGADIVYEAYTVDIGVGD